MSRMAGMPRGRRRTVRALVVAVCPPDVVRRELVDDVTRDVATTVGALSPLTQRAFPAAVLVIEAAGLRHGARFSRLAPETATEVLVRLSTRSPALRRLVRSVRDVIVVAYFDQPVVKEQLGYVPAAWTAATAARWREQWSAEVDRHRELLRTRLPRPGEGS